MADFKWTSGGLFDLQVNGYAGVDFNDPSITVTDMDLSLAALRDDGVTTVLPTIITASLEDLATRLQALDRAVTSSTLGPDMVPGYHLEGPFLNASPGYCGCHDARVMIDPDARIVAELERHLRRPILLVTLAPERAGAIKAIRALYEAGKTIAVGHSAAGFHEIAAAVKAGATLSTHLGNGLPQSLPKFENTLLAQLAELGLLACLIADGQHIPVEAFAALTRLKGKANCILVSDAVLAAAAPPGHFRFAGLDIRSTEDGHVARFGSDGLAGSALRLDQAIRNTVEWGIWDAASAIAAASDAPRNALARSFKHHGVFVDPGKVAWTKDLMPQLKSPGAIQSTTTDIELETKRTAERRK